MEPSNTSQYISQVVHRPEAPPAVKARFFYVSPIPLDDPLSPLPPPNPDPEATARHPPKPFSQYDNTALDKAWHELRQKILRYNEERGEKDSVRTASRARHDSISKRPDRRGSSSKPNTPRVRPFRPQSSNLSQIDHSNDDVDQSLESLELATSELPDTTGTPFIRAPSRPTTHAPQKDVRSSRPKVKAYDTYLWEDPSHLAEHSPAPQARSQESGPTAKVAVGISRLHQVEMPELRMTPIYWTPVNDTAQVIRGTWFYKDNLLPVETDVAIMLEAGYVDLQVWTQTWKDELNSAVDVGAVGEMKLVHRLWPEKLAPQSSTGHRDSNARPPTAQGDGPLRTAVSLLNDQDEDTPRRRKELTVEAASDLIGISAGSAGTDNKAAGRNAWGYSGTARAYQHCGIIYANATEARILKPSLLPSAYYGRRPLANYIRKGRSLGVAVVRGFDQASWDKLHPPKLSPKARKATEGVAVSASGVSPETRRKDDPLLAQAERPEVTDLILVIHGIGQQLSKRMFNFHFTHAITSFRREINVEVGSKECKAHFRKDMGSIMALPVNWRQDLSFEDGGYQEEGHNQNDFNLADITPDGLAYVRNIVSDVMLDVPYYLSHHRDKMVSAVVREANRVYQLWCVNNPGFAEKGKVHLIGHSLGSVMAVEILSKQPTRVSAHLSDSSKINAEAVATTGEFLFNTHNLFLAGSPVGFFLLLQKSQLLPRIDSASAAAREDPSALTPDVAGVQGQYGCIPVENVYNLINGYDPVATCMNATVDAAYAHSLKKAWVPSAVSSWFGAGYWTGVSTTDKTVTAPKMPRMASQVELETHDFSREEVAEKRMRLLNDNLQIDYFLRYGGGPLDIQYISMLSAHGSYWLLKDFTRMIVVEVGRPEGQAGTLTSMRAMKSKTK